MSAASGRPVTLEQLIAINDEIAALVRAGFPMELGLSQLTAESSGRLRGITEKLWISLNRGESLPEALESSGYNFPPVYRAVVEAGIRARDLPRALEAVSSFARAILETRRRVALALLYPCIVALMAYLLFVFFITTSVPRWRAAAKELDIHAGWVELLEPLTRTVMYWGPGIPIAVGFVLLVGHFLRERAALGTGGLLGWVPGFRGIEQRVHLANFSQLMAMLLDQDVSLPDSLVLAAKATGSPSLFRAAESLAAEQSRGVPVQEAVRKTTLFPPVLRWMFTAAVPNRLGTSLIQASEIYRRQAEHRLEVFRLVMPIVLLTAIGGGATLFYSLTLFLPMTEMLNKLSQP